MNAPTVKNVRYALGMLKQFASDLPDGMWDECEELYVEFHQARRAGRPIDTLGYQEALDEICRDWGFPTLFEREPEATP